MDINNQITATRGSESLADDWEMIPPPKDSYTCNGCDSCIACLHVKINLLMERINEATAVIDKVAAQVMPTIEAVSAHPMAKLFLGKAK